MQREVQFRRIERHRSKDNATHLYWLWHQGPKGMRGVRTAIALCGANNLPRERVTSHLEDATCKACLARAKEREKEA